MSFEESAAAARQWTGIQDCTTDRGDLVYHERTEEAVIGALRSDARTITMVGVTLGAEDDLRCRGVDLAGIFTDLSGSFDMRSTTRCASDAGEELYIEVDGFVDPAYASIYVEIYNVPINDTSGVKRRWSHCMIDLE